MYVIRRGIIPIPPHLFCPLCGARNQPQAQFCATCGQPLRPAKLPSLSPGVSPTTTDADVHKRVSPPPIKQPTPPSPLSPIRKSAPAPAPAPAAMPEVDLVQLAPSPANPVPAGPIV